MKPLINIVLLVVAFLSFSFSPANFIEDYFNKVVIDIGHGGKDSGTIGANNSFEKDVTFKVATQLGSIMEVYMPQVSRRYTRYEDQFIALIDRPRLANKEGADLYISIHANASSNPAVRGTETYVMGVTAIKENIETAIRENQAILYEKNRKADYEGFNMIDNEDANHILFANRQKNIRDKSIRMAWLVEQNFQGRTINRHSRGVKNANFLVLWKTTMPSVLVEIGYLSNSEEEQYLNSEEGIYETASALFRAIREYKEFVEK